METEAKYYVPEISEFFVGFEYEIIYEDEPPKAYKFDITDMLYAQSPETEEFFGGICSKIENKQVRVKYLDSEDIESLGFIFNAGVTERTDRFSYKNFMLYFNREAKIVRIAEMNRQIVFQRAFPMGVELDYKELFNGTVKNKSKLKQVLKMIGVH